ncbi:NtaA/DmoA family FMN-dependent monooxygenase [Mycolicibacterium vaccae]|uniref:Nitrilotriacetate monooxygenase component a/pristinamycin iia synthase subunit a n=1 Tax=Mycolicibacterium vaccae ATCC 25954 TaxID=1194972 RepID=K0V128_MYCVA|nr:NtaA/DmoA family FMN-dependent monooxygenase [Mycolicibacterium vaccae]ANI38224.1 nitrilotriacetate monooxygenase component a/pristinamycin iia synthase subunit a [Mycolicibacterium vaccae 95051]EJZ10995.1 nitrilotriacetate monooxygenase component a/pristinamycin iia synthase subunit a [Mycolicibacterium vaccae ATCC 25954]MCV7063658.1 NtaA/DmoA family FMN-dependent monooxygenase [Mycolicibacterium vaccae]
MTFPHDSITLNLNLIPGGVFPGAWRAGDGDARRYSSLEHYIEVAEIAERGKFDAVFLADTPVWRYRGEYRPFRGLDPTLAFAAIAQHTSHIGLVATGSSSYNSAYNLARRISTLDHISNGRAAWNIVATNGDDVARNFGREHGLDHDARYRRAHEFVEAVKALWDGWADDAWVADRDTGTYVDEARIRAVDYVGEHVTTAGPLPLPRSPQGHPVLVQAGSSPDGIGLASRFADAVYTVQPTIESAIAFRNTVRDRAKEWGRNPDTIRVLPGLITLVAPTEAEAREREIELRELHTERFAINALALQVGVPVEALDLDKELPWDLVPADGELGAQGGHFAALISTARREKYTVRQILARQGGGLTHVTAIGAPEQVADQIETWVQAGAADGFNIMAAKLPDVAAEFVDHVVPILQRKGLFRTDYPGTTLRDTLGLERPGDGFEDYVPSGERLHTAGGSGAGKVRQEAAFG